MRSPLAGRRLLLPKHRKLRNKIKFLMVKTWFRSALLLLIAAAALQGQSRESLLRAVAQHSKWSPSGDPSQYDDKNIESLAGKRAASLKHYGLSGVMVQDWNGPSGKVRLTLYEMVDASAAYGLFTLERNIGQTNQA